MVSTVLDIAGATLIIAGVALVSIPASLVIAGAALLAISWRGSR